MDDMCNAVLCGCLCAYCCAAAADDNQRAVYVNQPVVVQTVQPVMVQQGGQVIQGQYVQMPDGSVQFVPIQQNGQYVVAQQAPYAQQAQYGQPMYAQPAYADGQQQPVYHAQQYPGQQYSGQQQPLAPLNNQPGQRSVV
ncbi:Aste57867_23063 [Aphanomyces stellatus]|uniref:Aste57867_23063 protein n=1 Tax=Aphanomyces stellatus TaxID=120398 RepID=A0A485LNL9_9STRA|nr:hypothetical protein As57867_022992 [Aphanomyces stellatus]VFT99711.1 Aste57867_23063 [Aphanomyces stellatus]